MKKSLKIKVRKGLNAEQAIRKAEYDKKYRENNKAKILAANAKYRENNRDKLAEYRENNRDKLAEYRENNRDKIRGYQLKYRKNNKAKARVSDAKYRENNRDKVLARKAKYRKNGADELTDSYVVGMLCDKNKTKIRHKDVPLELIELKRVQLQINRHLRGAIL